MIKPRRPPRRRADLPASAEKRSPESHPDDVGHCKHISGSDVKSLILRLKSAYSTDRASLEELARKATLDPALAREIVRMALHVAIRRVEDGQIDAERAQNSTWAPLILRDLLGLGLAALEVRRAVADEELAPWFKVLEELPLGGRLTEGQRANVRGFARRALYEKYMRGSLPTLGASARRAYCARFLAFARRTAYRFENPKRFVPGGAPEVDFTCGSATPNAEGQRDARTALKLLRRFYPDVVAYRFDPRRKTIAERVRFFRRLHEAERWLESLGFELP